MRYRIEFGLECIYISLFNKCTLIFGETIFLLPKTASCQPRDQFYCCTKADFFHSFQAKTIFNLALEEKRQNLFSIGIVSH